MRTWPKLKTWDRPVHEAGAQSDKTPVGAESESQQPPQSPARISNLAAGSVSSAIAWASPPQRHKPGQEEAAPHRRLLDDFLEAAGIRAGDHA